MALVCTYALQYTLLRHVLLRVILHLEGIKARAAAMAFCDEEGVLPFTSPHNIYVWFSVRRNVQAQNEARGVEVEARGLYATWAVGLLYTINNISIIYIYNIIGY